MSSGIDLSAMYAAHNALRRDLELLARTTARTDEDPRRILRAAAGWELFRKALHLHHVVEDEALWPVMREAVAGQADELELLDAMEAEHEAIEPLLAAVDRAIGTTIGTASGNGDGDGTPERLGDLVDALAVSVGGHLKHEEAEALPLVQAVVTVPQWQEFGQANARIMGPDAARFLPWMLDGASAPTVAVMLGQLPEPLRAVYRDEWQPAYAALDLWGTGS